MNYKFGVYGDSIAFGYGNNNQSWFDELYLGSNALKLAQNGEKIEDVLNKIKQDNNHYDTLFFAVGINDLLSTSPQSNQIAISELIGNYKEILEIAKNKASRIVVQSVLAVREELFPNQVWLDEDKWAFNSDIELFNQKLAELCETHQIEYLDAYTNFSSLDLSKIYMDAVHLNKVGQQELAMVYRKYTSKSL
jgi:lysophospholipase L1-like esterase